LTDERPGASELDASPDGAVLCVDGDPEWLQRLRSGLDGDGAPVATATDAAGALETLRTEPIACVVSEARLPATDGLSFLRSVRDHDPDVPFVVFTDDREFEFARKAVNAGATAYVQKGDGLEELEGTVEDAIAADPAGRRRERYEARFDALTATPSTVVLSITPASTIDYAGGSVASVFGYEPAELVGEPLTTLIPDRLADDHRKGIDRYLETGEGGLEWEWIELPGLHSDGHEIPLGITFGVSTIDGAPYFTGIVRDISDRKAVEAERSANQTALQRLYQASSDPEVSLEQRCSRVLNLGRERLGLAFGFLTEIDEEAGRQQVVLSESDDPRLQQGAACPLSEAYCRKTVENEGLLAVQNAPEAGWSGDPAYERFDLGAYIGAKVWVDDELYGTLCFASHEPRESPFDEFERTFVELMSQWVGYEFERRERAEALQRQNERLDEFAGIVSHDLRNPLAVLEGSLELVESGEARPEDVTRAVQAAERMDSLIEDTLTLARQGETVHDPEPVSLAETADRSWELVGTAAATLRVETDTEMRAEPARLQRLFENLYRNAIEHAGDDVSVTVGATDDAGFYVEDDGPGIPPESREQVLTAGYSESDFGTGYGLNIVSSIAEAHGWTLAVTAGTDGGARFEFTGVKGAGG
jgi:PAS domain S-box-containing protein